MAVTLHNWSASEACTVGAVRRPVDEAGVIEAVLRARSAGRRLKVFGALHSWSDIALGGDDAISLDGLSGLTGVDGDRVTVRAGTRLRDLNAALDERGLGMSILGSVAAQSIAGATATGTHGSSLTHGNLSSFIRGMRIVTGTGDVLDLDARDPRLDAARVGLGALGIVTSLTLQVEPAFVLAEALTPVPLAEAIARIPELARAWEYVKLWWLPHTDRALIFAAERTSEPPRFSSAAHWFDERVVNRWVFSGLLGVAGHVPRLVPAVNRLVGASYFRPRRRVAVSHRVFNLAMPPIHQESEYAVPLERAPEALAGLAERIARASLKVDFLVELRFVRGDDGWMSPAHGGDVAQLGAYIAGPDRDRYFAAFEELMLGLGGRPHWGKAFAAPGSTVLARYPKGPEFVALARELDPAGVFRNPFLDRLTAP